MSAKPRKWKRGDVGPDGRVFLEYRKSCLNGERWQSPEKFAETREKEKEERRLHRLNNPEKEKENKRRHNAKCSFKKQNGSSYEAWVKSVWGMPKTAAAIDALTPDPGQTLAELIHELSGYPMETCEQIATPPAFEPEPEPEILDNLPPIANLPPAPDLF